MMMKNKKMVWIVASVVVLASLLTWWMMSGGTAQTDIIEANVKEGPFEILVTTTGELEPKNSVSVRGPSALEQYGIYQIKVSDLVPEGKVVAKDEFVASLDPTELTSKLKEADNDFVKFQAQFLQTQLDTSLTLRQARDELVNQRFAVTERELVLSQSKYEPPATIRQAEIEVEKAKRTLKQSIENYTIKRKQASAKITEVQASLSTAQSKKEGIMDLLNQLTIKAPSPGMVIYRRNWSGQKIVVGGTISSWDPTVAKLPDLTTMMSTTYINEVDVRKIKVGQQVKIGLDAVPDKSLTGNVVSVANVGEQRPNSDAKVFEVRIQVNEKDTTLRPSMTTSNKITTGKLAKVLSVPLDAVHLLGDSLKFVFRKDGGSYVRQEVLTDLANEDAIVISAGLNGTDVVALSTPPNADKLTLAKLAPAIKKAAKDAAIKASGIKDTSKPATPPIAAGTTKTIIAQ